MHTRPLLRPFLAALLMTVLLGCLSLPSFAAEAKTASANTKTSSTSVGDLFPALGITEKTAWLGDSRTAHLRQSVSGVLNKTYFGEDAYGLWDYKWGAKYGNFTDKLVPQLEDSGQLKFGLTVVIWMGYNDAVGIRTAEAGDYAAKFNELALRWGVRGVRMVVANIGPAGKSQSGTKADKDAAKVSNKKIRAYNKELADNLIPGIQVVDVYGYLTSDGNYATTDNTHYTLATSKRVYKYINKQL